MKYVDWVRTLQVHRNNCFDQSPRTPIKWRQSVVHTCNLYSFLCYFLQNWKKFRIPFLNSFFIDGTPKYPLVFVFCFYFFFQLPLSTLHYYSPFAIIIFTNSYFIFLLNSLVPLKYLFSPISPGFVSLISPVYRHSLPLFHIFFCCLPIYPFSFFSRPCQLDLSSSLSSDLQYLTSLSSGPSHMPVI